MKTTILLLVILLSSCCDKSWVSNYEHDYPIRNFHKIVDIPLMVVYGDADQTVPFAENFGRVDISGHKSISIIRKENVGHHPHSLSPCDTIVRFLMK